MFRVEFSAPVRGGRIRWFVARKDTGRIMYSCFPLSFRYGTGGVGARGMGHWCGRQPGIRGPRSGICNVH